MGIKDTIKERVIKLSKEYEEQYIKEQKGFYEEKIEQYEELMIQYYKNEIKIKFLKALVEQMNDSQKNEELENLKKESIVLLKKTQDIENSGILEEYDRLIYAINKLN